MANYKFRLYVMDESARARRAADNLRALCEARVAGLYELDIVDVLQRPDLAEEDRIIATPTALRLAPPPQRRVVGDLSDLRLAAAALEFPASQAHTREVSTPEGDET